VVFLKRYTIQHSHIKVFVTVRNIKIVGTSLNAVTPPVMFHFTVQHVCHFDTAHDTIPWPTDLLCHDVCAEFRENISIRFHSIDVCIIIISQLRTAAWRLIVQSGLDVPTFATRRLHACHHAVKLRNGTDGFTSPPKEGALRIFSP